MTTVDQVYKLMLYSVAKNLQDGYLSPDDFNLLMPQAEKSYLDYLLGQYQKYQPGRPVPPVAFAQTERVRNSLIPLIYGTVLNIDSQGIAPYPSDYEYTDAMWSVYGFQRVRFVQQDKLWSMYNSVIDPIETNPVYELKQEGFQFYPVNLSQARMSYVRTPPYMVWRYYLEPDTGLPTYDPVNSVQPAWGDSDILNVVVRALAIVGVNLQFNTVLQYSNDIKNAGQ